MCSIGIDIYLLGLTKIKIKVFLQLPWKISCKCFELKVYSSNAKNKKNIHTRKNQDLKNKHNNLQKKFHFSPFIDLLNMINLTCFSTTFTQFYLWYFILPFLLLSYTKKNSFPTEVFERNQFETLDKWARRDEQIRMDPKQLLRCYFFFILLSHKFVTNVL